MSKYSEEFKLEVVNYYLNNCYDFEYVAKQFEIPAWTTIRKWVRLRDVLQKSKKAGIKSDKKGCPVLTEILAHFFMTHGDVNCLC